MDLAWFILDVSEARRRFGSMCLAVPGRVVSIDTGVDPLDRMGMVDFGGVTRRIALGLIEDAQPGDDVLVHAGMAIERVQRWEAEEVWDLLRRWEDGDGTDEG